MPEHPPGTVVVSVGELARFSLSTFSLACLQYPRGTRLSQMISLSIPHNLNSMIREMTGEWLWIQSDDQVFNADSLIKMLDRDVDVLVPLILRRKPPFSPVIFKEEREDGYLAFAYDELPETGLLEVYAAGTGGMLIRKHVLEAIGDPWFEYQKGEIINEDVEFCRKVRDAGFKIHADMDVLMGHCGLFTVWPSYNDGWTIQFQMGEGPDGALNAIFVKPGERPPDVVDS